MLALALIWYFGYANKGNSYIEGKPLMSRVVASSYSGLGEYTQHRSLKLSSKLFRSSVGTSLI